MTTLKISGMRCGHCVHAVNEALSEVAGVDRVIDVSLERGEAQVEGSADIDTLVAAVAEEGYEAQAA